MKRKQTAFEKWWEISNYEGTKLSKYNYALKTVIERAFNAGRRSVKRRGKERD